MAGIRKKIGEILVEENLITEEQLFEALETQRLTGQKVGQILIDKGFIKECECKDPAKREYVITEDGKVALKKEVDRLTELVYNAEKYFREELI